jgi:hypothetical protein
MTNRQIMDKSIDEIQDRYYMYFKEHPVLIPHFITIVREDSLYVQRELAFNTLPSGIRGAIYETSLTWAPHQGTALG